MHTWARPREISCLYCHALSIYLLCQLDGNLLWTGPLGQLSLSPPSFLCVCVCREQPGCHLILFLKQGLSFVMELPDYARLVGQRASGICLCHLSSAMPSFSMWDLGIKPESLCCVTSSLATALDWSRAWYHFSPCLTVITLDACCAG